MLFYGPPLVNAIVRLPISESLTHDVAISRRRQSSIREGNTVVVLPMKRGVEAGTPLSAALDDTVGIRFVEVYIR
jgi:hypothetical protein